MILFAYDRGWWYNEETGRYRAVKIAKNRNIIRGRIYREKRNRGDEERGMDVCEGTASIPAPPPPPHRQSPSPPNTQQSGALRRLTHMHKGTHSSPGQPFPLITEGYMLLYGTCDGVCLLFQCCEMWLIMITIHNTDNDEFADLLSSVHLPAHVRVKWPLSTWRGTHTQHGKLCVVIELRWMWWALLRRGRWGLSTASFFFS